MESGKRGGKEVKVKREWVGNGRQKMVEGCAALSG